MLDECVAYGVRVKAFQLQYQQGNDWKFFQGKAMGPGLEVNSRVTARHVRLTIEGEHGPTINEFQLFAPVKKKAP